MDGPFGIGEGFLYVIDFIGMKRRGWVSRAGIPGQNRVRRVGADGPGPTDSTDEVLPVLRSGWSLSCHLQMAKWRSTLIPPTRLGRIISAREGAPMKQPAQYAPQDVQSVTGPRWHSSVRKHWMLP